MASPRSRCGAGCGRRSGVEENYLDCNLGRDLLGAYAELVLSFRELAFILRSPSVKTTASRTPGRSLASRSATVLLPVLVAVDGRVRAICVDGNTDIGDHLGTIRRNELRKRGFASSCIARRFALGASARDVISFRLRCLWIRRVLVRSQEGQLRSPPSLACRRAPRKAIRG